MSERQVLLEWLTQAARRLRVQRLARRWSRVFQWGLLLLLAHQVFLVLAFPPAVVSALDVLLLLAGIGLVLWGGSVGWRRSDLNEAAHAADGAGGWHDELKSAFWFSRDAEHDSAVVRLVITRAARTVAGADTRALLPWRMGQPLWGVAALAAAVLALSWWSPRLAYSQKQVGSASQARQWQPREPEVASPERWDQAQAAGATARMQQPAVGAPAATTAASANAAADQSAEVSANTPAGTASTTLRQDFPAAPTSPSQERSGTRASTGETPAEWLGSVVARLKEMMEKDDIGDSDRARATGSAQEAARIGRSDRGDHADMGKSDPDSQMRNADTSGGSDMRMNALGGVGPRNTLAGEGDGEEQSGRSGSSGGALGRRVGTSRAGAGNDDEAPEGNPGGGNDKSPDVLGKKTMRLALQLRRAASPAKSNDEALSEDAGSAEDFYAATRRQAARTVPNDTAQAVNQTRMADTLSSESTPLAYRAAVKDYFLSQHRKEK